MYKGIICFLLCLNAFPTRCQDLSEGEKFVKMGNEAFNNNEFSKADSLFTLSLKYLKHENGIYINRGLTRMMLQDTCNACLDFEYSAQKYMGAPILFDDDISEIYFNYCIADFDTVFYDKNYNPIQGVEGFKYYEVLKKRSCQTFITGELHKTGLDTRLLSMTDINPWDKTTTDIYALYRIIDTIRYYTFVYNYNYSSIRQVSISPTDQIIKKHLNAKYDFSTIEHKNRWMNVRLFFNPDGQVMGCEILDNSFKTIMKEKVNELQKDLFDFYKTIPKIDSPKLFKQRLFFTMDFILGI